jgi:hypothetical protein
MINTIRSFLTNNLRAVIFITLIIFIFTSFNTTQENNKEATKTVLRFVDTVVVDISQTFSTVADSTLISENTKENYDKTANSLQQLSGRLAKYKLQVPLEKGSESYLKVTKKLFDVIQTTQKQTDDFAALYRKYGENTELLKQYWALNNEKDNDFVANFQKTIPNWSKVIEIKKLELVKYSDAGIKKYYEDLVTKEDEFQKKYDDMIQRNELLKQEEIAGIKEQFTLFSKSNYMIFQRLKRDELFGATTANAIKELESSIENLKRTEKISIE